MKGYASRTWQQHIHQLVEASTEKQTGKHNTMTTAGFAGDTSHPDGVYARAGIGN